MSQAWQSEWWRLLRSACFVIDWWIIYCPSFLCGILRVLNNDRKGEGRGCELDENEITQHLEIPRRQGCNQFEMRRVGNWNIWGWQGRFTEISIYMDLCATIKKKSRAGVVEEWEVKRCNAKDGLEWLHTSEQSLFWLSNWLFGTVCWTDKTNVTKSFSQRKANHSQNATKCKTVRMNCVEYVGCHVKSMSNSIVLTQISAINNVVNTVFAINKVDSNNNKLILECPDGCFRWGSGLIVFSEFPQIGCF